MSFQKNRKNPRREETIDLVRVPCSRCINFSLPSFLSCDIMNEYEYQQSTFLSRDERERGRERETRRFNDRRYIYSRNREQVAISHSYYLVLLVKVLFPLAHRNVIIYECTLTNTMSRRDSTLLRVCQVTKAKSASDIFLPPFFRR